MLNQSLQPSPTVERVQRKLAEEETVVAVDIVRLILEHYPECGNNAAPMSLIPGKLGEQKHVDDWLTDVRNLFNDELVPELHGRLVIIGLSMLDDDLKQQLDQFKFLEALHHELKEPIERLLIDDTPPISSVSSADDSQINLENEVERVATQADNPLQNIEEDQLWRAAYAKYLAKRLTSISDENKATEEQIEKQRKAQGKVKAADANQNLQLAYAVHLYGPWGSGKSTLLNFISSELQKENWLVVEFNAWRNQGRRLG